MKILAFTLINLIFIVNHEVKAQTYYRVLATKGLVVRSSPSSEGKPIGKIPFRSIVKLTAQTDDTLVVFDEGKYIGGYWVEIEASSFYFINDRDKSTQIKGFVFDGFLECIDKGIIKLQTTSISEKEFENETKIDSSPIKSKEPIIGLDKICPMLNNAICFRDGENEVLERFSNQYGHELICYHDKANSWQSEEIHYSYYPDYQLLVIDQDHETYDLSTITGELIISPFETISSPTGAYRFCKNRDGQDRADFSFQMKNDEWYDYSTTFDFYAAEMHEFYWINDNEFICKVSSIDGELKILKGSLSFWPNKSR